MQELEPAVAKVPAGHCWQPELVVMVPIGQISCPFAHEFLAESYLTAENMSVKQHES